MQVYCPLHTNPDSKTTAMQMEKWGSKYLRCAIFKVTKYVCHWDPTFAAYLTKKKAEGKHYNVAMTHAAKKLVRFIYTMEQSGQPDQKVQ